MTLLLAAAAISAFSQDPKLSYTTPAKSAASVVRDLADKTGSKLSVSNALASEPLVISVTDIPASRLLNKIAEVTHAEWQVDGEVRRLVRTPAKEKELEAKEIAEEAAVLKASIAKLLAQPAANKALTPDEAVKLANETERLMNPESGHLEMNPAIAALMMKGPGFRAVTRVLGTIDPAEIVRGLRQRNAVFATNPTPMQRPLGNGANQILNDFATEHAMFVKATEDYWAQREQPGSRFEYWGVSRGAWKKGNPKLGVGKGVMRLGRFQDQIYVTLSITDTKGSLLVQGVTNIPVPQTAPTVLPTIADEPNMKLSETSAEVTEVLGRTSGPVGTTEMATVGPKGEKRITIPSANKGSQRAISTGLMEVLTKPEQHDPMGMATSEVLLAYTERKNVSLIANLDDRSWNDVQRAASGSFTASGILNLPAFQSRNAISLSDGWLTVTPRQPIMATRMRTNRAELGILMRGLKAQKYLSLDQIGRFSLSQEKPVGDGDLELTYMRLLNSGAADRAYKSYDWMTYRVYGSLSPQQRQGILSGNKVTWISLSQQAKDNLARLIFQGSASAEVKLEDGTNMRSWEEPVLTDWTELLPNGLRDVEITGTSLTEPAMFATNSHSGASEFATVAALAGFQFVRESPDHANLVPNLPVYDRFAPATLAKYSFRFATSPNVSFSKELNDGFTTPGAVALDEMPADFKQKVATEVEELKAAFSRGNRGTPPP